MKKIYMILTAVFALLSLSLNAQQTASTKKKADVPVLSGAKMALNLGGVNRAPSRAAEEHTSTLTFTAACGGTGTADDGTVWTVTSDASESTYDATKGIHYGTNSAAVSYINLSTSGISGTIKKVVVNASTANQTTAYVNVTVGDAQFGNGQQTLTTSAANYTFEGSATGQIVVRVFKSSSATRALYCKSITVTYETDDGGETTEEVTVCDGTETTSYLPVWGYNYDVYPQFNQMLYTSQQLGIPTGAQITSLTFYPSTNVLFSGGNVTVKIGTTTQSSYTEFVDIVPDDLTEVASVVPQNQNYSSTGWTINFTTPFTYEGGNLLVQIETETGTYKSTSFYGATQSSDMGFYTYYNSNGSDGAGWYGALQTIMPKATFTFEVDDTPVLTAPENGTTVNVGTLEEGGETSVSVTIPVTGRNLTEDLTVSVSGTGFTVTPETLSATDVNNGTATVTVTYTGTANGTGTLTIGSEEASTTVNLSATYIAHDPVLTAPVDGTTVDVGTNNGMGVSKTIAVSGTYLTEDLTVSVSGAGFTVSPTTLSADAVNNGTATVTVTYNGTTTSAGTLTISSGEVSTTVNLTGSYSTGIAPTAHGMVRMGTLRIVDQFAEKIPATNDHPYRYTYFLKLATRDTTSSPARVPVQHTGAEMNGYYTHAEMKGDTNPANFLTEDMLSAEVDMTLSPSSAPYFYTINSVKNGVPASVTDYNNHYKSYLNVLQRREAGDYQEMQAKYNDEITNPHKGDIYAAGAHDFFDYRAIQAESKDDSLSYVPIVWTKGIDRHYYVDDSLHNSYGAPIWEVRTGDVIVDKDGTVCQKQARRDANGNWVWNNSVNYKLDGTDYCLYFVSVDAQGILPVSNVEYEPYMFRLWLVDSTASLRNYTWELNDKGKPVKIVDAGAYTENGGMWKLLDTKMCENWHGQDGKDFDPDLNYVVSIVDGNAENHSWSENLAFVGPMNGFNPKLYVRFYYKIKGAPDPTINGMRGDGDEDNVGYVVLRGVNPDPSTAVHEIVITGEVESQTFYNVQGMQSDKPFDGINIVVTRYSNGATTTTKVRY